MRQLYQQETARLCHWRKWCDSHLMSIGQTVSLELKTNWKYSIIFNIADYRVYKPLGLKGQKALQHFHQISPIFTCLPPFWTSDIHPKRICNASFLISFIKSCLQCIKARETNKKKENRKKKNKQRNTLPITLKGKQRSPKTLRKLAERWEVLCLLPFQMVSASDYGFLSDLGWALARLFVLLAFLGKTPILRVPPHSQRKALNWFPLGMYSSLNVSH